jgi:LacI family transcriptional regulator
MGDPLLGRIVERQLPLVMVGRPEIEGVSYADVDNRGGGALAANHLVGLGRERIGMIGAPTNTTAGRDRLDGFVGGLAEHGRALVPDLRVDGDYSEASGYDAMQVLVDRHPDAVFVASDSMAIGALRALRERGRRVPDDVAVVGFDGFVASERTTPPLTTLRQPVTDTAATAVTLLNGLIDGTLTAPVSDVLPVELIVRGSTGQEAPAPAGAR